MTCQERELVYNLVYFAPKPVMTPLQTIGTYETKTHLADLLRRVRAGQGFCITQRGEPVADLLPVASRLRRSGAQAAVRMQQFMHESTQGEHCDIKALVNEGRD